MIRHAGSFDSSTSDAKQAAADLKRAERGQPSHAVGSVVSSSTFTLTEAEQKSTIRKIDLRLLIILGALYSIALIDRTNISTARIVGMAVDLELTVGERYSIITVVFFIPYILFELPSNILLRKVGSRNLLSAIAILWGSVMIAMGFAKNWKQLAVMRVLLGLLEAGFFPGCVFLISTWYTRFETQRRLALFYLLSMVVAGFSSIVSYGVSQADGAAGIAGWSWIFIISGIVTCAVGIVAFFLIVDFPDKNNFLTKEQTQFIIDRVNADRGDAIADKLSWRKAGSHLMDWKIWSFGLCFMATTVPSYAFAYFLPVILDGAGYSIELSLCMSAPPYVAAAIYTLIVASYSDKNHQRGTFICLNALVDVVGLMVVGYADRPGVRYFGAILAIMGAQANVPAVLAYSANNVLSHSKRSVSSAVVIGMGGVGGIIASTTYRQQDYPRYMPGLWITFGCQLLIMALVGVNTVYFKSQNQKLDEGRRGPIEGTPGFKYTI